MQSQTGPPAPPSGIGHAETNSPAAHRRDHNRNDGVKRLALFYLAHWSDRSLAAALPTLRKHAMIPPETPQYSVPAILAGQSTEQERVESGK